MCLLGKYWDCHAIFSGRYWSLTKDEGDFVLRFALFFSGAHLFHVDDVCQGFRFSNFNESIRKAVGNTSSEIGNTSAEASPPRTIRYIWLREVISWSRKSNIPCDGWRRHANVSRRMSFKWCHPFWKTSTGCARYLLGSALICDDTIRNIESMSIEVREGLDKSCDKTDEHEIQNLYQLICNWHINYKNLNIPRTTNN